MGRKQFEIGIDHPILSGAKRGMDTCLRAAVRKAVETGSMEGSATLKISFELFRHQDQETGEESIVPQIKSKFGYSVPMKDSAEIEVLDKARIIQQEDGEYFLINEQVSMDELMEEEEPEAYRGERQLAEVR